VHCKRQAASRADCTAGNSSAISTAMISIITNSTMRVNPVNRVVLDPSSGPCMGFSQSSGHTDRGRIIRRDGFILWNPPHLPKEFDPFAAKFKSAGSSIAVPWARSRESK
jgi:hypothetical protein